MLRNYLKTAFRSLKKNKVHSFINIAGLSAGMAVAMIIGLWIWDELSYDKYNKNYDRIAQVMQNNTLNGEIKTWSSMPLPLAAELRKTYGSNFRYVLMTAGTKNRILAFEDKKLTKSGNYFEPQAPDMLSLKMLYGTHDGLKDPGSILLSSSTARALFGDSDPMNKVLKIDNEAVVKVTGVYQDLPYNSSFRDMNFIAPWDLYVASNDWLKNMENPWGPNIFEIFVQITPQSSFDKISEKIKLAKFNQVGEEGKKNKPELFLYPMAKWHLHSVFKNGLISGGRIELVWLFGIVGVFVLFLACINFMNLSTARSEKRAKEVGIRKAIGSARSQLIIQFLSESLLLAGFAFLLSLAITFIILPFFNQIADKKMSLLWDHPSFWILGTGFTLLTGLIAGSYPAFYLSSFESVRALKGSFRVGRFAVLPRKVLVVIQFTVSVTLIIGTIVVFRQIEFAKNRPSGYNRENLIMLKMITSDIHDHFESLRTELKGSNAITEMAESSAPATGIWATDGGFEWKGKDPALNVDFPNTGVSFEFGKTVGWQFKEGRDFSRDYPTDSAGFVLNEAAAKFMGFKNPVGEMIKWDGHSFNVIGVIKDMVVESPYQPVRPSLYSIAKPHDNYVILKLNPAISTIDALAKIESLFLKYSPATPFDYQFVDEEYSKKFGDEQSLGKLTSYFAVMAILISCLGLFGMASFMAEQRIKEIAIRKVLGASIFNLLRLMTRDFVMLVLISLLIASPIAYYFLHNWLENYQYRTGIAWWIFAVAGMGALLVTLMTVGYQAISTALANPVKSLKSE